MSIYQDSKTRFQDWITAHTERLSVYASISEMAHTTLVGDQDQPGELHARAAFLAMDAADAIEALTAMSRGETGEGEPRRVTHRLTQLMATCLACLLAVDDAPTGQVAP